MIVKSKPQKNSKQQYSSKQHGHPRALLKQAKQSIGLSTVVPFVPFGCSSRSSLPPFHRYFTAQKKWGSQKIGNLIFSAARSSSSHVLFLRSVGRLHPQYRFIPLRFASYTPLYFSRIMPAALRFSAVALSHRHRGWLRSHNSLWPIHFSSNYQL